MEGEKEWKKEEEEEDEKENEEEKKKKEERRKKERKKKEKEEQRRKNKEEEEEEEWKEEREGKKKEKKKKKKEESLLLSSTNLLDPRCLPKTSPRPLQVRPLKLQKAAKKVSLSENKQKILWMNQKDFENHQKGRSPGNLRMIPYYHL